MDTLFDQTVPFGERLNRVYICQLRHNPIYRRFAKTFGICGETLPDVDDLPLLPIRAFKEAELICDNKRPQVTFKSSGTGAMSRSRHHVADLPVYHRSVESEFYRHFSFHSHRLLCYTPGYSDNPESSLIGMLSHLVNSDPSGESRFLNLDEPITQEIVDESDKPILLFGAAFGLLDLIGMNSCPLPAHSEIVETGGMKTFRREISKQDLRKRLSGGFDLPMESIHSEYGMCELLSQFYAIGSESFTSPHWTRVTVRRADDPSVLCKPGEEGKLGIIDLANIYSCPFILTEDRGVMDEDGRFRVLGRWDKTDLRGCNFLIDSEL